MSGKQTLPTRARCCAAARLRWRKEWVARRGDDLNDEEKAFTAAGAELRDAETLRAKEELRRERARLRLARWGVGSVAVIVAIAAGLVLWRYSQSDHDNHFARLFIINTVPRARRIEYISDIDYKKCEDIGVDPISRDKCLSWQEYTEGGRRDMIGTYKILVTWEDGTYSVSTANAPDNGSFTLVIER
jgi:hypothetical protein